MPAPSEDALPLVSCVIAAYNHARYLPAAIESALGQDYPASRLEVVVIDDGSTDDTRDVLNEIAYRNPGRVRWAPQVNAGYIAATSAAIDMARGDLIAVLDADDQWLEHKTRAQVDLLAAHPTVGLVYGDMSYIDADGRPLEPSVWELHNMTPLRGQPVGELCRRNVGGSGTIMVRREALNLFHPYPPEREAPCQDWWAIARVATGWDIDYLEEPCALYRRHDSNMTDDGADPAAEARDLHREIRMIRTLLERHVDMVSIDDAIAAVHAIDSKLVTAGELALPAAPDVDADEARRARGHCDWSAELRRQSDHERALRAAFAAVACDPVGELPRAALDAAARSADAAGQQPAAAPQKTGQQQAAVPATSDAPPSEFVVLVTAADATTGTLAGLCAEFDGGDDLTLIVAFDDADPASLQPAIDALGRLKTATPLDARAIPISQLEGVMCHARLVADDRDADGETRYGPGMVSELRARYEAGRTGEQIRSSASTSGAWAAGCGDEVDLPLVSAIVAAYNYGRYLPEALDSALNQDYPPDRLEVVVVDDGSTDDTPDVLAEYASRHPGRIRYVRQDNAGYLAATDRAFSMARGEMLAILDADDVWLPDKTIRQVAVMRDNPTVGLVFGEMTVVDDTGGVVHDGQWESFGIDKVRGDVYGETFKRSVAGASSIMVRASLLSEFSPMPAEGDICCQDWWIAHRVARVAQLDYVDGRVAHYREHGSNMSADELKTLRQDIQQIRYMLMHSPMDGVSDDELAAAVTRLFDCIQQAAAIDDGDLGKPITGEQARRSVALREDAEQALQEGMFRYALEHAVRAIGYGPARDTAAPAAGVAERAMTSEHNADGASTGTSVAAPPARDVRGGAAEPESDAGCPAKSADYTDEYYDAIIAGSVRSAGVILPTVFALTDPPGSVVDVGCGVGAWAATAKRLGCRQAVGIDGDYVDRSRLLISPEEFVAADLNEPLDLGRRFDLAISMEVAEHLQPGSADGFVASLCDLSDVVLFSAAIPNQGGQRHVNEQWPEYWAALFARRGYLCCDAIRDRVWNDPDVEWWYAQNALLFVTAERLERLDGLHSTVRRPGVDRIGMVHPDLWDVYRPWRGMAHFAKPWPPRP